MIIDKKINEITLDQTNKQRNKQTQKQHNNLPQSSQ